MRRVRELIAAIVFSTIVLLSVSTAQGHHSIAAGFIMAEPITVTGIIKEMEWINPHSRMIFEVEAENGEIQSWMAWFTSANNLFRRGWRAQDLPVGETITVSGFPARDGSNELYGGEAKLADGRTLFAGNASGDR